MKTLLFHRRERFDDHDTATRDAQRTSPVAKARASPAARAKAASKHTDPADGAVLPVHSLRTLLADLATLTRDVVRIGQGRVSVLLASPAPLRRRALDLLGANLAA